MKKTLVLAVLALIWNGGLWAQETTTVQVTPSDQVIYPDANQILNKTTPAQPAKTLATPTKTPSATVLGTSLAPSASGWYLQWTLTDSEANVRAWADALGRSVELQNLGNGTWVAWQGPLASDSIAAALGGQEGRARLVKR